MPACSRAVKRQWKYRSLEETLRLALPDDLSHSDADQRREAVARLAEGGELQQPGVFEVLEAVARTDPATQIRCIAVRGLTRYDDERPAGTLLKILSATTKSTESPDVLPANDDLRWEALRGLLALAHKGVLGEQQREIARDIGIKLAAAAAPRNVRLVALELLGYFYDRAVFPPLIRALRDEDFAMADTAERSLIMLTGVTQAYNADAWEAWLASAADPFAKAGQTPQTTRPAGPSWWDAQRRAWRRGLKLGNED